jgi:hypothetical protein
MLHRAFDATVTAPSAAPLFLAEVNPPAVTVAGKATLLILSGPPYAAPVSGVFPTVTALPGWAGRPGSRVGA